jgi:toxin ParE1/3/4
MKHYTVIFTPIAEHQLSSLYSYIADVSGEIRAEDYVNRIIADCKNLSLFPERGIKRDDIRLNLRIKGFAKRVTIAFAVNSETRIVAIHGIFYGGQNFEQVLYETYDE